ncbi:MAG: homocysteine S-methyltransferase family protein [Kiloniellaceae bacterium]
MIELQERLERGEVILLDGAMGTELQRRGVPMDRVAWSGAAIATHPDVIRDIHEDYIRAGADVIITNTFGAARNVLEPAGLGARAGELNRRAVELAHAARERAARGRNVWVAGSISSFLPENAKDKAPRPDVAQADYREQAAALAEAGVDLIALEMMQDIEYGTYAVEAATATGLPVWVGFSCRPGADGKTLFFRRADSTTGLAEGLAKVMAAGGALAGVMHSEVATVEPALRVIFETWSGPVAAYPHSGHFVMPDWQFVDIISPEDYAAEARKWVAMGVQVVGGCCGIGPEHIRLLRERLPKRISP